MRTFTFISTICILMTIAPPCAIAVDSTANRVDEQRQQTQAELFSFNASSRVDIQAEGFSLSAEKGSLTHALKMSVTVLPQQSSKLPYNLTNVTEQGKVIRLLPSGEHFKTDRPARITLSYDPKLIPIGYTTSSIYTFYCDENSSEWKRLERISVDTVQHTITSLTTHFSDFANAVIKEPEMPESSAFVPTQMENVPDADPLQGIPMIAPPIANNRGTAELTYPIKLPPGRRGLQPNVDLHYSSAGSNGILGVGWSLNTPAITMDTRWGVPRYDPIYETEQYLVNGEAILLRRNDTALALPYQDTTLIPREKGRVRFYARDTKNQNRIYRFGNTPSTYWWAVTDRNGVTTYYGRAFNPFAHFPTFGIDENSVIRTAGGCIAYWAATATVDIYGNYIQYHNEKVGNNIHVVQIDYTGKTYPDSIQPAYKIHLKYRDRNDTISNARLGVLQTEGQLLCHLLVQYQDPRLPLTPDFTDNLVAYFMQYTAPQEATLYKSRLESVVMLDSVYDLMLNHLCDIETIEQGAVSRNTLGTIRLNEAIGTPMYDQLYALRYAPYGEHSIPANTTTFSYADAPAAYDLFSVADTISNFENKDLSHSHSSSWSLGGTATVGLGANVIMTTLSGGGNYDYSRSQGETHTMLLDLDGDGLMDIVYERNDTVYYKKQLIQNNSNSCAFANQIRVPGLKRLSHEVTNTSTWGVQLSFGANLSYNHPNTTTYIDTYFSDVNADGLPDLIDGDSIRINQLINGIPTFGTFSGVDISMHNSICGRTILNGEVDEHLECVLAETLEQSYTLNDFFGSYEDGDIEFEQVDDASETFPSTTYYDQDLIISPTYEDIFDEIKSFVIDTPIIPPLPRFQNTQNRTFNLPVLNDSLIYRIEGNYVNAYRQEYICTPHNTDPTIETVKVWVAPDTATISIQDLIKLKADTSMSYRSSRTADGVIYIVQHCRNVSASSDGLHLHAAANTILRRDTFAADDHTARTRKDTLFVNKGDVLLFRLCSGENNRFDKTQQRHIIRHLFGTHKIYDSRDDYLCTGKGFFVAHNNGVVKLSFEGANEWTSSVRLKVTKKNAGTTTDLLNTLLTQGSISVSPVQDSVQQGDTIIVRLEPRVSLSLPRWSDIHVKPTLEYDSYFQRTDNPLVTVHDTVTYYPDVQIQYSSIINSSSISAVYGSLFGPLHKGWGQFAYQNRNHKDTIMLDSLVNTMEFTAMQAAQDTSAFATSQQIDTISLMANWRVQADSVFATKPAFNPIAESNYWIPMRADSRTEQWIVYGNMGCIGKVVHSNEREISTQNEVEDIVEYDSYLPYATGETRKNNFVRKKSTNSQHTISFGAAFTGRSESFGTYESSVDYMDMNGDGYPDFVGREGIQYSMPWGGIGKLQKVDYFSPYQNANATSGISFSSCPTYMTKNASNNIRDNKFHLDGAFGATFGEGETSASISYIDVNADGLPDKVDATNGTVRYNLGYGFSNAYAFTDSVNNGNSSSMGISLSGSLPFSLAQVSISGGVSGSQSSDTTKNMLSDINGDGLPDLLTWSEGQIKVAYNKGGVNGIAFDALTPIPGLSCLSKSTTESVSGTLGITGGFTFLGIIKFNVGIQSSPYGESDSQAEAMLVDMNGDGLTDYVWKSGNQIYVRYNKAGAANLLTAVTNPTGQKIQLEYALSTPSSNHRSRQWNLIMVRDSARNHPILDAQESITSIEYDSAYYDNYEKTDYGYAHIRTIFNGKKVKDESYRNRSYLQHGELREELLSDHFGNKYIRRTYESEYADLHTGNVIHNEADLCQDANARVMQEGSCTEYFEGGNLPQITTCYNIQYDKFHNVVEHLDHGDISLSDDDWKQVITYLPSTANNMVSLPKTEKVFDAEDNLLRSSRANYDIYGNIAHIHFLDTILNEDAVTHLQYDNYGNVAKIIMPEAINHERNWTTFYYDTVTHSHVTYIDNPHLVRTHMEYNYRWGRLSRIIDPASDTIDYIYDYEDRIEKIIAPRERRNNQDYTIQYTYNLVNHNLIAQPAYSYSHIYKDMYDSAFVQQEVSIYDIRGRLMQKKHYAELLGVDTWIVDGAEDWDTFGRVKSREYPFIAIDAPEEYEPINNAQAIVQYGYDVLDRMDLQLNADGSHKDFSYHFDNDINNIIRFVTITTDENHKETKEFRAPQEWLIQQEAADGSIAHFEYSPIGELLRSTDPENFQTTYTYDMFGRVRSRTHPDAGTTTWTYDPAGNMIRKQMAILADIGAYIEYEYHYNRLRNIHYPLYPENDVTYWYNLAGRVAKRQDGAGTEEMVYDELGNTAQSIRRITIPTEGKAYIFRTLFNYDSFGRMRHIVYPDGEVVHYGYTTGGLLKNVAGIKNGQSSVYLRERHYDEQSRKIFQRYGNGIWTVYEYSPTRQWLTLLNTEAPYVALHKTAYNYDGVGNIVEVTQDKASLGAPVSGGPYHNVYTYDSQYRLVASSGQGDFPYDFHAGYSASGRMGRKVIQTTPWTTDLVFAYDRQRQTHQPRVICDLSAGKKINLFWDANGNLAQAVACQQDVRLHEWDEENRLRFVLGEKYVLGYYGYDANGERIYKLTGEAEINYTPLGGAMVSADIQDAVLYPNPYIVITSQGYTKHYYAGSERLATKIGGGGLGSMVLSPVEGFTAEEAARYSSIFTTHYGVEHDDPFHYNHAISDIVPTEDIAGHTNQIVEYECGPVGVSYVDVNAGNDILLQSISDNETIHQQKEEIYFYHGNHLGSAAWITDSLAKPVQYIHYAPYGELIANQQETWTTYDERYKFTGKERDAETGYDYFGARFYASQLGHWLSVDPLSYRYPHISPYAYAAWNPIKYIDPDGRWVETAWDIANIGMDVASLKSNINDGNVGGAIVDGLGLVLDMGAAILPAIPGGAGAALKAYRTADKVNDLGNVNKFRQAVTRGIQSEQRILKDMGLTKNTKKIASRTNAGETVNIIPDAIKDGVIYEVKDAKAVYNTKQIQGEYQAAKKAGYDFKIVTGEKTHVSPNIPSDVEIIRRSDLGPQ